MSKIYEALQNAQEQRKELAETPLIAQDTEHVAEISLDEVPELRMESEMLMLYHGIEAQLPGFDRMAIQFIGSRTGEGTSTIVREFAYMSASRLGKSVLVLDADHNSTSTGRSYGIASGEYRSKTSIQPGPQENSVLETRHQNVFLSPVSRNYGSFMQRYEEPSPGNLFEQLKLSYDLILIDSPPASDNTAGFAFCRKVDGVVLIVEAEKTRWPVAEALKNRIISCGGRVLGIALNKRRYDIPEYMYTRL